MSNSVRHRHPVVVGALMLTLAAVLLTGASAQGALLPKGCTAKGLPQAGGCSYVTKTGVFRVVGVIFATPVSGGNTLVFYSPNGNDQVNCLFRTADAGTVRSVTTFAKTCHAPKGTRIQVQVFQAVVDVRDTTPLVIHT